MPESLGQKHLNRLKAAAKRETREALNAAGSAIVRGVASAAGAVYQGYQDLTTPGPSPAERHRALVEEGASTRHTTRLRKTPKVNR